MRFTRHDSEPRETTHPTRGDDNPKSEPSPWRRLVRAASLIISSLLAHLPSPLNARPIELPPIEVEEKRREPGSAEAEDTAFSTTLDAEPGAVEGLDVAGLLSRSVGVHVRRTGGFGDFSSVLIRGASADQVSVFLDGVRLSTGPGSVVDLSMFPLLTISRVEVFRGYAPAELGSEAVGGAINLVVSRPGGQSSTRLLGGLGSFGYGQLGIARADSRGSLSYSVNLGLQSWVGDFTYFSDNGTPYNLDDDRTVRRQNNEAFVLSTVGFLRWRPSKLLRVSILESFALKQKGLAGLGHVQALETDLEATHNLFSIKVERRRFLHPRVDAMARLSGQLFRQRFKDPAGELGLSTQNQLDTTWSASLLARLSWSPDLHNLLALIPEWKVESYHGEDPGRKSDGMSSLPRSRRYRFAASLRDRILLASERIRLTPVVRFDAIYDDVSGTSSGGSPLFDTHHHFVSPRLGARVRITHSVDHAVDMKANVGRYFRPPSLFELFGNQGTARGNPELRPETGVAADAGITAKLRRPLPILSSLFLEGVFFGRYSKHLIKWVQNSQRTAVAKNLDRASALGVEATVGSTLELPADISARAHASYTLLWTKNLTDQPLLEGNRLPGRPLHELDGRLEMRWRHRKLGISAHYSVRHVSKSFLDEANLFLPVPTRTLHDAGVTVSPWHEELTVAATFKNIANVRVEKQRAPAFTGLSTIPRPLADFGGYPLPGWSFLLTLVWRR